MAPLEVVLDVAQSIVTPTLTQAKLDFSRPTPGIRPGPKHTTAPKKALRGSFTPANDVAIVTNKANEDALRRQIQALPTQHNDNSDSDSNSNSNSPKPRPARRRRQYSREVKLQVVQWATSTYVQQKDGSQKLISRYEAAKRMDIDDMTLKGWMQNIEKIAHQKKGSMRSVSLSRRGKEDTLELELYREFKAVRAIGRQISRQWFIRHGRAIYRRLHPERIVVEDTGRRTYLNFKFSNGWFQGNLLNL